jgi:hypothetical protein
MPEDLTPTDLAPAAHATLDEGTHFVLFDSSGNMIDSFRSADEAAVAVRSIQRADAGSREHICLVAYDADGNVIDPRSPASVSSAG